MLFYLLRVFRLACPSIVSLSVLVPPPPSPSTSQQQILSYLWAWLATAVCEVERPRLGFVEQAGQGLCFQWGMLPHKSCPVGCRHEDVELLSDACLGWFVLEDFLSKSSS